MSNGFTIRTCEGGLKMRFNLLKAVSVVSLMLLGAGAMASADAAEEAEAALPAMAGDAEAGGKIFVKCRVCHAVEKDVSKIGPSLYGVFGRKAGTLASYTNYSDQMKASGVLWNEQSISEFIKSPRTYIKNTRMLFVGLRDEQDIANLLAHLKSIQ